MGDDACTVWVICWFWNELDCEWLGVCCKRGVDMCCGGGCDRCFCRGDRDDCG